MIIDTPEGIQYAKWLARRGAVKLESRGLRRRGRSATAICREELGLPRGAKRQAVLAAIEKKLEEIRGETPSI